MGFTLFGFLALLAEHGSGVLRILLLILFRVPSKKAIYCKLINTKNLFNLFMIGRITLMIIPFGLVATSVRLIIEHAKNIAPPSSNPKKNRKLDHRPPTP